MNRKRTSELRSWLKAIGTVTAAVNAACDLKSLLDLVAATAHDLLDLSYCAIMLPDDTEEYLSVAGASGLPDQYIARVNRDHPIRLEAGPLEGAPASRAFRSGKPCMVSDMAAEPSSSWTDVAREEGYRSILVVPLLTSAGVVGTLNSYRTTPHDFSPQEVEQLELLAEHGAIALTSARILDDLRDQHRRIVRSEEIHDRLLRVAVRSGGVAGIASALNDLLGCEVVIRDAYGATLAAEPALSVADRIAASPAPFSPQSAGDSGLVKEVGEHVAANVMLDGTSVATVWLLDRAGKLDPLGVRAVEHASVVLSLELLRQRTAAEVEQTLRGELLADLLDGADPRSPAIRDRAGLMGHNLSLPHRMLVAAARSQSRADIGGHTILDDVDVAQRAASEAVRLTSHLRPRPLIAAVRGLVVALWPQSDAVPTGEQLLRRAFASAQRGGSVAMAVTAVDTNGIPAAYRGARGALAFAAADGESRTAVTLDDLGAAGLLLQFAEPEELRRYAERTIGVLRRYDTAHGAELLKTLRAYLNCDLDRRTTGEILVLHPNTVSQRLRRIETLTGLDLRSPRSVIEARTALMLTDVADAVSGVPG
ncbi:helix-turn-helix domain-containing protein [Amycolatopsis pithecellobii]|uniref:GAF domain-containing protein n=1 Tax=Amycolatopsis pithecellobii TaxID=664692 RepID=A0A6N7YLB0_9PSEU|nr:GAF domain-containing protein [Amycolatopsis pithecellobii]MTD53697.1 GAF domain-containing protein [Amycolatopsis pithecellobii]